MNEDFIEVKERLIDMYNFNKHIKVELKPLGAKAILDYINSKDKEIERLNNNLKSLYYSLEIIDSIRDENVVKMQIRNLLYNYKELKGSGE